MLELFDDLHRGYRERLLAMGWREVNLYGAMRWEDPLSHAWFSEGQAVERLLAQEEAAKRRQVREDDGTPE